MQDTPKRGEGKGTGVEGEGSYSATRDYNERTAKFIEKGKVEKAAQEAKRAMDSPERAGLEKAEAEGKAGKIPGKKKT
jgi:hypothetical protein